MTYPDPDYRAWLASQQPQAPAPAPAPQVPLPSANYAPPVPQAYAPAPTTQYAPPPQVPAPGSDPFRRQEKQVAALTPRIQELAGRLVAFRATKFEPAVPNTLGKPGETQARVTADVYIFDGAPMVFGGSPDYSPKPTPHTHVVDMPTMFTGMWITKELLIRAMTETPVGGQQQPAAGIIIGRIGRSQHPGSNHPWIIEDVSETSPEYAAAVAVFVSWQSGQTKPNLPRPLAAQAPTAPTAYVDPSTGLPVGSAAPMAVPAPVPVPQPMPAPVPMPVDAAPPFPPQVGPWAGLTDQYAALSPSDKAAVWGAAQATSVGVGNPFSQ